MEGWGGEVLDTSSDGASYFSNEEEPLIPLKDGDKVVSAVLVHPNKVVAVSRKGRVYMIDAHSATCVQIIRASQ
jgi:hypothetical protein